jgi:mono/diheme cytochrome c family protein
MKMKAYAVWAVIAVTITLAAVAQNSSYKPDEKWVAPPDAAAKANPVGSNPDAVAGGKKIYLRSCAECHNEDGSGLDNAANLMLPVVQKETDGTLFWKISNGNVRRGMPAFSRLPETQRWQIVSFLRTLKAADSSSTAGDQSTKPKQ